MSGKQLQQILQQIGSKQLCPVAGVVKDGRILVGLRHYAKDTWKTVSVWTIPGGRCDAGETVETTLRREIEEETGITRFEIRDFIDEAPGAKAGDRVLIFFCTTREEPTLNEPEKFSEWKWIAIADYANRIPENYINERSRELITDFLLKSFKPENSAVT